MLRADGALQGAHDPTLHQREDQVHAGQRLMRRSTRGAHGGRLEGVEPTGGLWVGRPTVTDDATAGLDAGEQKLVSAAEESELAQQAEENTRAMLTGMFKSLDIEVTFTDDARKE